MVPVYPQELKPEKQKPGHYMLGKKWFGRAKLENNKVSDILFPLCCFTLEHIRWKHKNYYKL